MKRSGRILVSCRVTLLTPIAKRLLIRKIGLSLELIILTCLYGKCWVLYTLANCSLLDCGIMIRVWVVDLENRNANVLTLLGI